MYGGKQIAEGDTIYLFASENEGGQGLIARGVVTAATAVPRKPNLERQTPRVNISVRIEAHARRPLGRTELKKFTDWKKGGPKRNSTSNTIARRPTRSSAFPKGRQSSLRDFFKLDRWGYERRERAPPKTSVILSAA